MIALAVCLLVVPGVSVSLALVWLLADRIDGLACQQNELASLVHDARYAAQEARSTSYSAAERIERIAKAFAKGGDAGQGGAH